MQNESASLFCCRSNMTLIFDLLFSGVLFIRKNKPKAFNKAASQTSFNFLSVISRHELNHAVKTGQKKRKLHHLITLFAFLFLAVLAAWFSWWLQKAVASKSNFFHSPRVPTNMKLINNLLFSGVLFIKKSQPKASNKAASQTSFNFLNKNRRFTSIM